MKPFDEIMITLTNDRGSCYVKPDLIAAIDGPVKKKGREEARAVKLTAGGFLYVHCSAENRQALIDGGVLPADCEPWGKPVKAPKKRKLSSIPD